MTNKLILLATCFFTALNVAAQTYSGGSGTENDPYLISSKADMETLATANNNSSSYSTGKYFLLTQDITEAVTTIISTSVYCSFKGTFDGGGHTITVNISTTAQYVGIFGCTSSATIKNLGVTGSVERTSASSHAYAGGICGYAGDGTTITNCYNNATISATSSNSAYAGGICGDAQDTTTISNCCNTATVSTSSEYACAGGICGMACYGTTITNCYNTASVSSSSDFCAYAGGICGYAIDATISNCYNAATVSATSSSSSYYYYYSYAGGICGYAYNGTTITNCLFLNISAITSSSNSIYIGRISGYLSSGTISNCYANAAMTLNGSTVSSQDATSKDGKDLFGSDEIFNRLGMLNAKYITYGDTINININNEVVTFLSLDNTIAEITGNILTAKKPGNVVITANYNWNDTDYQVEINQTVHKKDLIIQADNKQKFVTQENPSFTVTYTGFVNNDDETDLDVLPQAQCSATASSPAGTYTISVVGRNDNNYSIVTQTGTLTIKALTEIASVALGSSSPNLVIGMNTQLNVSVANDAPMLAFQTDVAIPAFMSVDLSNVAMTNRCTNAHSLSVNLVSSNGSTKIYRFLIYSANNTPIQGISGELLEIPLTIDWASAPTIYSTRTVSTSGTKAVFYLAPGNTPEVTVPSASATLYFHRKGDVNINGTITISDVVAEVEYILQNNPSPFLFEAGDMNDNGIINVFDLTQIVNVIMGVSSSAPQYAAAAPRHCGLDPQSPDNDYTLSLSGTPDNLTLSLANAHPVVALNFDLTLPEGVSIDETNIAFADSRTNSARHTLAVKKIDDRYRFVVYSARNQTFDGNAGSLLSIPLIIDEQTAAGELPVTLSDASVAYREGETINEATPLCTSGVLTVSEGATGIDECDGSQENGEWRIYPNPARDYIVIAEFIPTYRDLTRNPLNTVQIYDITGKLTGNFAVRNSSIVIGNLPAGVYFVKVGNEVKKFVKE